MTASSTTPEVASSMNTLDATNARLWQLEELEARMIAARKDVLEKRRFEDEKAAKKRGSEDAKWHLEEQARENEEDEMRARKRQLSKAATESEDAGQDVVGSIAKGGVTSAQPLSGLLSSALHPSPGSPGTVLFRSSAKTTRKRGGGASRAGDKRHGPPDFNDGEGRPMWIRPSDGRFVYLRCNVDSCTKMNFKTVHGFLTHIVKAHQRKGMYADQKDAIEKCGLLREHIMGSNNLAVDTAGSSRLACVTDVGQEFFGKDNVQDDEEPVSVKKEVIAESTEAHQELDIYGDGIPLFDGLTGESAPALGAELYEDALLDLTEKADEANPELDRPKVHIRKRSLSASIWDQLGKRMRFAEKNASRNFRHQSA